MTHYSTEQWIDFVNGTRAQAAQREMQKHLDSGCETCSKAVATWRKVQSSAGNESKFVPPADTVRVAKAAYGSAGFDAKPGLVEVVAQLVFDSFETPATAGTRSAALQGRQMLFAASTYQIDLSIEVKPDQTRLSVTGQLTDTADQTSVGEGIIVTLSNRRGQTIQTMTNSFGEFQGEIENRGDLELTLLARGEKRIVISLRDALDRVPTRGGDGGRGLV
jgi:hypothetical protein